MPSNLDRYKKDLNSLIARGDELSHAIQAECVPNEFARAVKENLGNKANEFIKSLPSFTKHYQSWYSEARILVKQLLPDRLSDFVSHYEKPKSRKDLTTACFINRFGLTSGTYA